MMMMKNLTLLTAAVAVLTLLCADRTSGVGGPPPTSPTITVFPGGSPSCGSAFTILCEVDTGGALDNEPSVRVIRLSDMVDLATDARFKEIPTPQVASGESGILASGESGNLASGEANIAIAYNLSQFLLSDNGNYTCKVISVAGNVTAEAVIVAAAIPPIPSVSPSMENVKFVPSMPPQTAEFSCVASRPTPVNISFELLFNGMPANMNDVRIATGLSNASLTANVSVLNIIGNSSGVFTCVFMTPCGDASVNYTLVVDVTPVIVDFAPLSGTCASAQTLSCSADTGTVDPQDATITIIRESDGMDLASDSRFSPSRTNTPPRTVMLEYAFTGLLVDNSLYTCIVNTSVGSIARDTSVMISEVMPTATVTPSTQDVVPNLQEGVNPTFTCFYVRAVDVEVSFALLLNGAPVTDPRVQVLLAVQIGGLQETATVTIINFTLPLAGTYTCAWSTPCGNASSDAVIRIPPTITDFPSLVPDCGTTGSIVCHVNTGQEEAQDAMIDIIRQSDGVNLNVDMRFSRTRTDSQPDMATLSYSYQHTLNDDGVYMCVVMTTFGSDKRNATIASGPSPPFVTVAPPNQDVQLPSTTGPSRSFTCTGAENAFPATQSFELRLNGMSITNGFSFGMSVVSIVETTAFSGTQITAEVTINPVLLEAENNYTCVFLSPCGNTTATHSLNVIPPIAETSIPPGPIDRFFVSSFGIICRAVTPFDSGMVTVVQWVRSDDMSIVSFDPASPVRQASSRTSQIHIVTLSFDRFTDEQAGTYLCASSNEGGNFTSMIDVQILRDPPVINSFIATPSLVRASIDVDCEINLAPNDARTEFEDIDIVRVSNGLNASMLGDRFTFTRTPGTGTMVTARLTVMDGIKADNGDYRCVVSTVQGSASMTATVNFTAPPPMIESIQPEQGPFTMLPGSSMPFSFTCTGISFLVNSSRATLMWTGPDDVSINTLPRAQQTLTIFNDSILQNTLNLTGALVQDSGRYECTVSNQCGEDARSIDVTFEGIAALDGVSPNPFVAEVMENAGTPVLLSLQHVAQILGTVTICAVDIRLTHQTDGMLNSMAEESIFPTRAVSEGIVEGLTPRRLQYNLTTATEISQEDLEIILRNTEYINFADEFTPGPRLVTWLFIDCPSSRIAARGTTIINPIHVNDNTPQFVVNRVESVVPQP